MVQFPGEFPDLLPFFSYNSFSLWWVSPKDTMYRKGASGNYHVSATKLFKHLTIIYNQHLWSHPWKISHIAEKIEKSWQEISVAFALRTAQTGSQETSGQGYFFLLQFHLLGVSLTVETRGSESGFEGELEKSISPGSPCLETQHHDGSRSWSRARGGSSKFLGRQGTFFWTSLLLMYSSPKSPFFF